MTSTKGHYRNNLIARTGVQRGVVLSGAGENLTDSPGAGNDQVGDWCRDFSALFSNVGPDYDENLSLTDSEFSVVLADARGLQDDDLGDANNLLDDDDLDPEESDGSLIDDNVSQFATITSVTCEMRFKPPAYTDATVYTVDEQTGEIDSVLFPTLQVYLDSSGVGLLNPAETLAEADVWHENSAHLRFTLHWALMVIKCDNPISEGLSDYATENGLAGVPNNPIPAGGPHGVLAAYGGELTRAIRLWSPHEGSSVVRIVQRGEVELPYNLPRLNAGQSPGDVVDIDLIDGDLEELTQHGWEVPAVDSMRGKNIVIRLRSKRDIRIKDDELVVFTVQTGRARLLKGERDNAGNYTGDAVIAAPSLIQGRGGPLLRMYHHYARVTGRVL